MGGGEIMIKKLATIGASALVVLVTGSSAVTAIEGDSVVGGNRGASISARSGPNGEDPSGTFTVNGSSGNPTRTLEVTCLRVEGNRAFGFGTVRGGPSDARLYFLVVDSGDPTVPDQFAVFGTSEQPCSMTSLFDDSLTPVDFYGGGNFVVNDE